MWVAKDIPKSSNAKFACMRGSCTSAVHTRTHARIHRCSQIRVRINACACQGVCSCTCVWILHLYVYLYTYRIKRSFIRIPIWDSGNRTHMWVYIRVCVCLHTWKILHPFESEHVDLCLFQKMLYEKCSLIWEDLFYMCKITCYDTRRKNSLPYQVWNQNLNW